MSRLIAVWLYQITLKHEPSDWYRFLCSAHQHGLPSKGKLVILFKIEALETKRQVKGERLTYQFRLGE